MNNFVAGAGMLAHNRGKCLITLVDSGKSPRKQWLFLRPNDLQINGRGGAELQDPQGEYCSPGYLQVINTAPTSHLNKWLDTFKVSDRSIQMPKFHQRAAALKSAISALNPFANTLTGVL